MNASSKQATRTPESGPTVEFAVHFRNGQKGRRRLRQGRPDAPQPSGLGTIPRISRLMALAIHFDRLVRQGAVRDYAELARLGGVSRARISQIMDLLNLKPAIQEQLLFLPRIHDGRETLTERRLRQVTAAGDWRVQDDRLQRILRDSKREERS